jgi:hypothetical protein
MYTVTNNSRVGQFVSGLKDSKWSMLRRIGVAYRAQAMLALLEKEADTDSGDAQGFNARSRDQWVEDRARSVEPGSRILDVGAGTAPYRNLFDHCKYETQDFAQYDGYKGPEGQYAHIDYVSDITSIPVYRSSRARPASD